MSKSSTSSLQFREIALSKELSISMVEVKGGRFWIGDESGETGYEKPVHEATVHDFWIAQYPVSQGIWQYIMGGKQAAHWRGDTRPIENISWEDSKEFIRRLNYELGLRDEQAFRLPTSAEWEYAARGGMYSRGYTFSGSAELKKVGWYDENSFEQTHPIGLKLPNELGLYDMSGGLWEWVEDRYDENYYAGCKAKGLNMNPKGPDSGQARVLRGGSWFDEGLNCGVAIRYDNHPGGRYRSDGLRLSRTGL